MATKSKPKSNRAKFTLAKKTEKPKAKTEAPKKEKKEEVINEPQEVEVTQTTHEEVSMGEIEKHREVPSPEITHQPEPVAPEPVVSAPATEEHTETQSLQPELPTSPFSAAVPETPSSELHENPFAMPNSMPNEQHLSEQQPIQATAPSVENSELSPTPPKEDTLSRQSSFSTPVEVETSKGKGLIIYFVIVAFIAFLVGIGSMALFTFGFGKTGGMHIGLPNFMAKASPTPTKTAHTESPTPVPTKAVDLSTYNIKILNGSGITGAASKLKTELTTDGFTVVTTGNADKSDYTDTIISAKKDINPDYLNKLKDTLKKDFTLGQDTTLSDADAKVSDVVVIIGSNTAK